MKTKLALICILVLAATLRLWQLGSVPMGVTNDENGYIYNAYSIGKTGKNVYGEILPLFTWHIKNGFPFMPVPTYMLAPILGLFGISPLLGRLPFAILGTIDVYLIFVLINILFKNIPLALLTASFLAISPWHVFFSRSAYDTNIAFFWYLLAIVMFLKHITYKKIPFVSIVCLLLAVYSYRGANPLFPPLSLLLLWYTTFQQKAAGKSIKFFLFGIVAISLLFFFTAYSLRTRGYTAEIGPDTKMQNTIDTQIRESQGPLLLRRIFINKPIYILKSYLTNYLESFSVGHLFIYGEGSQIYSMWIHGKFYLIDAFFLIIGIAGILGKYKKPGLFILCLWAISALPGTVGGPPFATRNLFFVVPSMTLIAVGVIRVITFVQPSYLKKFCIITIVLLYTFSVTNFLFDYHYRYAYQRAESWFKGMKDLTNLVETEKKRYPNVLIATSAFADVMQYALYTGLSPEKVQKVWHNKVEYQTFTIFRLENITFATACPERDLLRSALAEKSIPKIIITHEGCLEATPSSKIPDYDGNTVWKIYRI